MIQKIKIINNSIIGEAGGEVILKGVAIPDPYRIAEQDKYDVRKILDDISLIGGNVVRITIKPSLWQGIDNFLEKYIDNVVEECKKLNLYCVLDWHSIGNPIKNETRMQDIFFINKEGNKYYDYDVNLDVLKKAWLEISSRYGKEPHVLFELFNEPAPGEKDIPSMGLSALYWKDWKDELEILIKIIRERSDNLIIIGPPSWAYDLSKIIENPLNNSNILYSVHPYPIHKNWKENFDIAINKIPIIVTEWGFQEKNLDPLLNATKENYGDKIINYMNSNNISWIAWCYDFIWDSKMLKKKSSWNEKRLTDWGNFVVNNLRK